MNYARALHAFYQAAAAGNVDTMFQAMPDRRLVHPVGCYGFVMREFDSRHLPEVFWSLACSGLRTFDGVLE